MTGGMYALVATLDIFAPLFTLLRKHKYTPNWRFCNSVDTYTTVIVKSGLGSAVLGIFNLVTLLCSFVKLFLYTKCLMLILCHSSLMMSLSGN